MGTWTELERDPDFIELVGIVRSDNALVALEVTRREVSWTRFMARLLDPAVGGERRAAIFATELLRTIAATRQGGARGRYTVVSVKPEVMILGKRVDLELVLKAEDGARLPVLIENKIEADESEDQLLGYRNGYTATGGVEPQTVLIDLKDHPDRACTDPQAAMLHRHHVRDWLTRSEAACQADQLAVPSLVADYRAVFRGWDLAMSLRRRFGAVLRRDPPRDDWPEWPLVEKWLCRGQLTFLQHILSCEPLASTIRANGLVSKPLRGGTYEGVQISGPAWRLARSVDAARGIEVHFESQRAGQVDVHVELCPYQVAEAEEARDPSGLQALRTVRTGVLRALRERLSQIGWSTRHLRDVNLDSTLAAAHIDADGDALSAENIAKLFERAIRDASPLIEVALSEQAAGWCPWSPSLRPRASKGA